MKMILVIFIITTNWLLGSYLVVGDSSNLPNANDGDIILNPISLDFSNIEVSSGNLYIDIPIYIKSDTTEAVTLKLSNISPLTQGGENIPISLSYRGVGISSDVSFNLINNGEGGRDGNTIVGKIRVSIPSVAPAQTYGGYSGKIDMELSSGNYTTTAMSYLNISANVLLVAIAGFEPVSSYTNGKKFLDATIDYGSFEFDKKNSIERNLFIKSNSSQNFSIRFDTTELISQIDNNYKIPLKYYYNNSAFKKNNSFTALNGKNKGESSIGTIKFETETITQSLIAGEYQANIGVTITLE